MKQALLIIICLIMIVTSASAAALDSVTFDIANNTITVSGNVGESINGHVMTLCVLNSGETIDNVNKNIEHIHILNIDESGKYTHSFGFSGDSAAYVFLASDEAGIDETKTVNYYNKDTLDGFAHSVGEGKLTDSELKSGLMIYGESLGADMKYFSDERNFGVLISNIRGSEDDILKGLSVALSEVIDRARIECELLDKIEACTIWYEVEEYLRDNAALIGIDFDDYDKLSDKSKVCSAFIGVQTQSFGALAEKFDELVEDYTPKSSEGTGKKDNGGGGGKHGISSTGMAVTPVIPQPSVFTDIASVPWAQKEITAMYEKGILSGIGNGLFNPNGYVTREETAKIIALSFNMVSSDASLSFDDVSADKWYYPYVSSLCAEGIVSGISDDLYGVGQSIKRQDMAVMLYRVLQKTGYEFNDFKTEFADYDLVSDYAKEAVSYMAGAGIINGMDNGCFAPHDGATRAQTAKLVYAMLQIIK